MTPVQAKLYRETMNRSKKVLEELNDEALEAAAADDEAATTKAKGAKKGKKEEKKSQAGNSTHIIMDLRKAASHPLLFRRLYDDKKIRQIAKECLNTPTWCDSNFDFVVEDLEVMSDAELHHFCVESDYTVSPIHSTLLRYANSCSKSVTSLLTRKSFWSLVKWLP
jgi:SWI/SNF-related matrix-associated actin-dependent regulator 1 of chromatin subfamily A